MRFKLLAAPPFIILAVVALSTTISLCQPCADWDNLIAYKGMSLRDHVRDRFGNIYVAGSILSDVTVGSTLVSLKGFQTAIIIKFDKNHAVQWVRDAGNDKSDYATNLEIDQDDNLIVVGGFSSSSVQFDCYTLSNTGRVDIFIVKYSRDGYVQWAIQSRGPDDEWVNDMDISPTTNTIAITGSFLQNASIGEKPITMFGGYDSYAATIAPDGVVVWARSFGNAASANPDYFYGVAFDSHDNICLTGLFESPSLSFDQFTIPGPQVSENYFLAKLDKSGKTIWAKGGQANINQSGCDLETDKDDNIWVVGRYFFGDAKFDNVTLHNQGEADVFILKYNPDGQILRARSLGGSRFDSGAEIEVTDKGTVFVSGYFYSNTFNIDSVALSKPTFAADVFVIRLSSDLAVECIDQVSGGSESLIGSMKIDRANNAWLIVTPDLLRLTGGAHFGTKYAITDLEIRDVVVSLGNAMSFDAESAPPPGQLSVTLGKDIELCPGRSVTIDAGAICKATYLWSNGRTEHDITVNQSGLYWVEVHLQNQTTRDSVQITVLPPLNVYLGADWVTCPGNGYFVNATQTTPATYVWNDGSTVPSRLLTQPGVYWAKATNACQTDIDTVSFEFVPPLKVDLGPDQTVCFGEQVALSPGDNPDASYHWQDGSTESSRTTREAGIYSVTVTGECEVASDTVSIKVIHYETMTFPNVITPNGDKVNDFLELPAGLAHPAIRIYNRWGKPVYSSDEYDNTWSGEENSSGVYYYIVTGACISEGVKSYLQVVH